MRQSPPLVKYHDLDLKTMDSVHCVPFPGYRAKYSETVVLSLAPVSCGLYEILGTQSEQAEVLSVDMVLLLSSFRLLDSDQLRSIKV